jgi:hypothetical protein
MSVLNTLFSKCGFVNITINRRIIELFYRDPKDILRDIKGSGAGNPLTQRYLWTPHDLKRWIFLYKDMFSTLDSKVSLTLEVFTIYAQASY